MQIGMYELLCKAQEMIARKYPTILTDKSKRGEIKNYIAQFLYDTGYTVEGYSMKQVTDRLFSEMAEYSFLTAYLNDPNIEEININGWDDVALTYLDGHIEKSDEQFFSPGHAVDIIKRLLLHSGMTIDNAVPKAEGHLPNNTRITVIKTPIVDEDRGIAASIRMLHPQRVDRENLIRTESITDEMLEYRVLYRYKIKRNLYHGGRFTIEGEFVKENTMSEDLREKLLRGGVPGPLLERFMGKEMIA